MHKIQFIENSHRYLLEDGSELISVSAFTEKFKKKVDWNTIAKRVAAKESKTGKATTAQDILKKWERKRDLAANIGTIYHNIREQQIINSENPIFYDVPCSKQECEHTNGLKYSIPINKLKNNTVYPELMIYDIDSMICGQADKVIVANNKINIWDYKTDAEIKFQAFSSKWVEPAKLLPPLSHLDDCNGIIYSIKMSLYMYLLWKSNKGILKPGDIIIEHVHLQRDPNDDNIPILVNGKPVVKKIEKIQLPYRKKEVMEMLETLKIKK
jgi:hypothetical protein